jgi:hypothetical protein
MTQTLGGLAGSAVLSTYQLHREQVYSSELVANSTRPTAGRAAPATAGAVCRADRRSGAAQRKGTAQLAQITRREANVRAFNDVFALSGVLAMAFLFWLLLLSIRAVLKQWPRQPRAPAVPTRHARRRDAP